MSPAFRTLESKVQGFDEVSRGFRLQFQNLGIAGPRVESKGPNSVR